MRIQPFKKIYLKKYNRDYYIDEKGLYWYNFYNDDDKDYYAVGFDTRKWQTHREYLEFKPTQIHPKAFLFNGRIVVDAKYIKIVE